MKDNALLNSYEKIKLKKGYFKTNLWPNLDAISKFPIY